MEHQSNVEYASCFPPRLEDAGLEDCALPLEKIQVWLVGFYLLNCASKVYISWESLGSEFFSQGS
jgi:hypothetical protein